MRSVAISCGVLLRRFLRLESAVFCAALDRQGKVFIRHLQVMLSRNGLRVAQPFTHNMSREIVG